MVLILIAVIITNIWPTQEDWFVELGLLGENKTADSYFSNEDSILEIGEKSSWYIYVHNHLGSAQTISLRVKLLNSLMELPNDLENNPSVY